MEHENHLVELFVGYSFLNKEKQEMKANCSVTLIKGERKIILVSFMATERKQNSFTLGLF